MSRLKLVWILTLLLAPSLANAQLWQGGELLAQKQMNIGFFGQVYGQTYALPSAFMGYGTFSYGVTERLQFETRLGLGMLDFYFGAFVKFSLLQAGEFRLASLLGIHKLNSYFLDWNLIASYDIGRWQLYLAPILNASLSVPIGIGLIPGGSVSLGPNFKVYAEGNINITGLFFAGSAGLKYVFD